MGRGSAAFRRATSEVRRWDWRDIAERPSAAEAGAAFLQRLLRSGGPFTRLHHADNVKRYLGKRSRCATYVELLEEEVSAVTDFRATMSGVEQRLVEVGFNEKGEACKAAYVCTLPATGRVLFTALGADGGVKTWYITPKFKDRKSYRMQG